MKALLLIASLGTINEANFQSVLDEIRVKQDIPGIGAVVIRDDAVIFAGGSGVADLETKRPIDADTVFYIGSISKVLTAVLTLHLVEQSTFDLEAPVAGIAVSENGGASQVSISHLLTHSSGLEREGNFDYWFSANFPDREALDSYLAHATLRSSPGEKLHYSNVGFAALGRSIESATGLSFDAALQKHVLGPLRMNASGSPGPTRGLAQGYSPTGRVVPNASRPFAGVGRQVGDRNVRMYHDAKAMTPAFGMYSTARDLSRLATFLIGDGNENVLSIAARESMRQRQSSGRGLGIGVESDGDRVLLTHGGWFAAHRSQLLIDATNKIAIVVLTNSDSATPRRIADSLYREVLR